MTLMGAPHLPPTTPAAFWRALGTVMPDYDGRKGRLRAIGVGAEW